jgi:hypothetical protein
MVLRGSINPEIKYFHGKIYKNKKSKFLCALVLQSGALNLDPYLYFAWKKICHVCNISNEFYASKA